LVPVLKNILEYIPFLFLGKIIGLFGLSLSRKFSIILAFIFFYFIPIRKQVVFDNLRKAFPDFDEKKLKEVAFGCYRSVIVSFLEILCMQTMKRSEIIDMLKVDNEDLILENYKYGKGVILLSAHFGNWELIAVSISARINIPFHVVVKHQSNPYVDRKINSLRIKWGNEIVSLGISIRNIYKELKNKNLVAMVADQRGPADGLRIKFFNIETAIYSGPAILAIKTGAPLIYGLTIRQPDFSYKVVLEKINLEDLPYNEEEKVKEISQRLASFLEKYIRHYPEQWLWMHKIWKY
jgi:Kdo2-lipid IVA lauroyltransferase/acyltransferase